MIANIFNIFKSLLKQLGIILIYLLSVIILSTLFKDSLNINNPLLFTLSNILNDLIILIIFLLLFRHTIIKDFSTLKMKKLKLFQNTFIYYIFGFVIMYISLNIITIFFQMPSNEVVNQIYLKKFPIYTILSILITSPIIEELMTRVILKDTFKHPIFYYLLSGLIFGLLHIISPLIEGSFYEILYIIPYGALGFCFAMIYHKTNNIWTNISYHSFHNLLCLITLIGGNL